MAASILLPLGRYELMPSRCPSRLIADCAPQGEFVGSVSLQTSVTHYGRVCTTTRNRVGDNRYEFRRNPRLYPVLPCMNFTKYRSGGKLLLRGRRRFRMNFSQPLAAAFYPYRGGCKVYRNFVIPTHCIDVNAIDNGSRIRR
jgi:hypothetical protein